MNMLRKGLGDWWLLLLLGALGPLLLMQMNGLWSRAHFQFFPMAWGLFLWLGLTHRPFVWSSSTTRIYAGMTLLVIGASVACIGAFRGSPWVVHYAAILLITAWGLLRLERVSWQKYLCWTLLLWVTLPLPLGYDQVLVQRLQSVSARSASSLLDLVSVAHIRSGNLIEIHAKRLFVDEACSGIDSLYALLAITIATNILQARSFLVGAIAVIAVPFWAAFGNMCRLFVIAWSLDSYAIDLSGGWQHTVLGLSVFGLSSLSIVATTHLLSLVLRSFSTSEIPSDSKGWHLFYNRIVNWPKYAVDEKASSITLKPNEVSSDQASRSQLLPSSLAYILTFVVAVTSLANAGVLANPDGGNAALKYQHFEEQQVEQAINADSMPSQIGGARRIGFGREHREFGNFYGEHSTAWTYDFGGQACLLSLDFPFSGFHELWICYENSGNRVIEVPRIVQCQLKGRSEPWDIQVMKLEDEFGSVSYVWFSLFDVAGNPIEMSSYEPSLSQRLQSRFTRGSASELAVLATTFQFQMFVQSGEVMSEEALTRFTSLYEETLPIAIENSRRLSAIADNQ